jgi:hypothetical protein
MALYNSGTTIATPINPREGPKNYARPWHFDICAYLIHRSDVASSIARGTGPKARGIRPDEKFQSHIGLLIIRTIERDCTVYAV